jgi:hypothetical protein
MIDLLSAMTIAQGAIAGTAANVARTRYYEKLAKLEIKEDLQSPLFGSDCQADFSIFIRLNSLKL